MILINRGKNDPLKILLSYSLMKMKIFRVRYVNFYRASYGLKAGQVVHLLTGGDHLEVVIAALAVWYIGAVPAFGESSLPEEALVDQVEQICEKLKSQ